MDNVNFINFTSFCINIIPVGGSDGLTEDIRTAKQRDVTDTSTYVLTWMVFTVALQC